MKTFMPEVSARRRGLLAALAIAALSTMFAAPDAIAVMQGSTWAGCSRTVDFGINYDELPPRRHMAIAPGGDVVITGCVFNGVDQDFVTARFDTVTGALLWRATYDGSAIGNGVTLLDSDHATHVVVDGAGDVVIAGAAQELGMQTGERVIKYHGATGAQLWNVSTGAWGYQRALAVCPGGEIVAASLGDGTRVSKLHPGSGAPIWSVTLAPTAGDGFAWLEAREVACDGSGNAFVFGSASPTGALFEGLVTMRLDAATGAVTWRSFTRASIPVSSAVVIDAAGDVVVAGHTSSGEGIVAKYAASNGATLWRRDFTFLGPFEGITSARLDAAGNVFVVGKSLPNAVALKLAAGDGQTLWSKQLTPPDGVDARYAAHDVAVDAQGDAFIAGFVRPYYNDAPQASLTKLRGSDGAVQWEERAGPSYHHSAGFAVAIDAAGQVVVSAGGSDEPAGDGIVRLLKRTAAGAAVWSVVFPADALVPDGDADQDGLPNALENDFGRDPLVKDNDVFNSGRLFVMQVYRDFFGKEGDPYEVALSASYIDAGVVTRAQSLEAYLAVPAAQTGMPHVARLYLSFFNRIPDFQGFMFQVGEYVAGVPLQVIAQNFALSPEFTSRYGALTDEQYVDLVYQNVLGRAPDPGGRLYYLERLADGRLSRGEVMVGFSESPEFEQLVSDETLVIITYSRLLRRTPERDGFLSQVANLESGAPRRTLFESILASAEYRARFLP